MFLEDEETVEIEKIISHRSIGNDLKYRIKHKDSEDVEWVSANYLKFYKEDLLEAYDKENNINGVVMNSMIKEKPNLIIESDIGDSDVKEDTCFESSGCLALTFVDLFGIKMEYPSSRDESSNNTSSSNILQDIQFGAAEYMSNNIIKHTNSSDIPAVHIESEDMCSSEDIGECMSNMNISDMQLISDVAECKTDKHDKYTTTQVIGDTGDLYTCTSDYFEAQTTLALPCVEDDSVNDNEIDNNRLSDNIASKKNITIGKLKKATKNISESKTNAEQKTVKSLLLPSQLSSIHDPIDDIFYNLPVVTKIAPPPQDTNIGELQPLTLSRLLSIINTNDLKQLHTYSQDDQTNLKSILKSNQYLIVRAVSNNFISMVGALILLGADIDGKDLSGCTSLLVACDNENEAIIDTLINNGASINIRTDGKNNLLVRCITKNKLISLRLLLNAGIDFSSVESLITDPLSPIGKIFESHKKSLLGSIEENILVQLGPHVQINKMIMSPRVLSLYEMEGNEFEVIFLSNISPIIENHCNLLFLVTGLLHGSSMKLLISDANKITSVVLNDIEQQSLIEGQYITVTSFSPVKDGLNKIVVRFDNEKCRKIRLIIVAFNVTILD